MILELNKKEAMMLCTKIMLGFSVEEVAFILNDVVTLEDFDRLFKMDYTELDYDRYGVDNALRPIIVDLGNL